jgi:hypothetical protein
MLVKEEKLEGKILLRAFDISNHPFFIIPLTLLRNSAPCSVDIPVVIRKFIVLLADNYNALIFTAGTRIIRLGHFISLSLYFFKMC